MMPVAAILTALEAFGSWCFKHWRLIGSAIVVSSLLFMVHVRTVQRDSARGQYASEKQAHDLDKANWKAATAKAQADDLAHARDVESQQAKISQETDNAYQLQLADLRANLARWMHDHAASNNQGSSGAASLPDIPEPAGSLPQPAADAIVSGPDLDKCAVDYSYANGLWSAWQKMSAIKR